MFCLFFVFFKQKTAYEMRISDWSSDVCSSDLDAVDAAEIGTAAQIEDVEALELLELIFAVVVVKARDELERLADGRQDPHFLGELLEQIGRASCRERVCQYV